MTTVAAARGVAARWVAEVGRGLPGYRGAFLTGSAAHADPAAILPPSSDVDVTLVVDDGADKIGKFALDGVVLEISPMATAELADPDRVARTYWLAPSFAGGRVLDDPAGVLARLENVIVPTFDDPPAVLRRCADAERRVRRIEQVDPSAPWPQIVTATVFPTAVTTHIALVAARRNPTVRTRYVAVRGVLHAAGEDEWYARLLDLLVGDVSAAMVRHHADRCAAAVELAGAHLRSPFPFAADLTVPARPITIGGTRALIDAGDHREAVFWLIATFARAVQVLDADAPPDVAAAVHGPFAAAVAELVGLTGPADVLARRDRVLAVLPALRSLAARLAFRPQ